MDIYYGVLPYCVRVAVDSIYNENSMSKNNKTLYRMYSASIEEWIKFLKKFNKYNDEVHSELFAFLYGKE